MLWTNLIHDRLPGKKIEKKRKKKGYATSSVQRFLIWRAQNSYTHKKPTLCVHGSVHVKQHQRNTVPPSGVFIYLFL